MKTLAPNPRTSFQLTEREYHMLVLLAVLAAMTWVKLHSP